MVEKKVFFQALLTTLLIFGIGIVIGFVLESYRSDKIETALLNSEVRVLDEQLRVNSLSNINASCTFLTNDTLNFADQIYNEAKVLDQYESSGKFKSTFLVLHKRYDLLRFMLWEDTKNLNDRCGNSFHIVVYLYDYQTQDINQKALQNYYSEYLLQLKNKYNNNFVLLPIAEDLISSTESIKYQYNLTKFPVVIVDNNLVISDMSNLTELDRILNSTNSTI